MDSDYVQNIINDQLDNWLNSDPFKGVLIGAKQGSAQYLLLKNLMKDFVMNLVSSVFDSSRAHTSSFLDLSQVQNMLNYKDLRSVVKWCQKHKVFVLMQGNSQFVNKTEFLIAFHQPFIKHLQKTSKNWKDQFLKFIEGNVSGLLEIEESSAPISRYVPQSNIEKSFLNKIKKI